MDGAVRDMASVVKSKVQAGEYASESDVTLAQQFNPLRFQQILCSLPAITGPVSWMGT